MLGEIDDVRSFSAPGPVSKRAPLVTPFRRVGRSDPFQTRGLCNDPPGRSNRSGARLANLSTDVRTQRIRTPLGSIPVGFWSVFEQVVSQIPPRPGEFPVSLPYSVSLFSRGEGVRRTRRLSIVADWGVTKCGHDGFSRCRGEVESLRGASLLSKTVTLGESDHGRGRGNRPKGPGKRLGLATGSETRSGLPCGPTSRGRAGGRVPTGSRTREATGPCRAR
jgi:hypothetical protein